jgi:hypothetical protein
MRTISLVTKDHSQMDSPVFYCDLCIEGGFLVLD